MNILLARRGIGIALGIAILVIVGAWLLLFARGQADRTAGKSAEKKILYYQSPMHPWVKSNKPGKCTVCGMELVPVYEGAQPVQATTDIVMLPPGSPNVASIKTVEIQRRPLT